jgi:hypothetical protein
LREAVLVGPKSLVGEATLERLLHTQWSRHGRRKDS